jgi:type I restriction enzyme S subunit
MRIDEIFSFEKGILQSSKCVPGDFDFITASSDWKTHNEYTHDCEALIFAAAASGSLGRTHYVNGKFVSSDLCFIITPKDQENLPVDLKFYHILFNELKDEIVRNTKAGTSKEAIGLGNFGKYELPYFDIDIQIEIKNQFVNSEEIKSSLTTELNQQVDLVKKLRQQLLRDAVQGKLVEQNPKDEPASELIKKIKAEKQKLIAEKKLKKEKELPPIKPEEIPFEIPENWIWCRLGEIVSLITSGSRNWNKYYSKEGVLFIRSQNIKPTQIDLTNQAFVKLPNSTEGKRTAVKKDDILITITGAGVSNAGLLSEMFFDEGYISQHVALIRLMMKEIAYWIHFCIISDSIGKSQFSRMIYGDKPGLNLVQLNSLVIPLPPLTEQNRIVQKLDELMQYCNELEASIKESENQNEKLLQQVLREALRKDPILENDLILI